MTWLLERKTQQIPNWARLCWMVGVLLIAVSFIGQSAVCVS